MPHQEDVNKDCDRCSGEIDGFRVMYSREEIKEMGAKIPDKWDERDEFPLGTAGYYRTNKGQWSEYTEDGIEIVCDECMENDPRYISDYGH